MLKVRQVLYLKHQIRKSPAGCRAFLLPRINLDIPSKKTYNASVQILRSGNIH